MTDQTRPSQSEPLARAIGSIFRHKLPQPIESALERVLLVDRLFEVYERAVVHNPKASVFDNLLDLLHVHAEVSAHDLTRIPREGPVVVVANHPFGLIEGPILGSLLMPVRPDTKFMCNSLLGAMPEIGRHCILVNPFGGGDAVKENLSGLKEAIACLRKGGMLAVFPAGEVAHMDVRRREIVDPAWNDSIARIARRTGAAVIPMFFDGANSPLFQVLGLIHPKLRTAMLPHEFLNKQHTTIELRIGNPIPAKKIATFEGDRELIEYLRKRTYLLKNRKDPPRKKFSRVFRGWAHQDELTKIVDAAPAELLETEVASLGARHLTADQGEYAVYLARAAEIPNVMREIGRLREVTFRQNGEGTGKALDIDAFDSYYLQLFVWNREANEVVGAYRLGPSDEILAGFGRKGLYTSTVFAYKREFLERIGPALEMGRSFVRVEYQKSYAPLLLLWKGIGRFVSRNPRYKVLFGPVSISNEYGATSRQLMVDFLKAYCHSDDLARLVRARSPFRRRPGKDLGPALVSTRAEWDIEELSALVADIETDQKGVPVLLRQYLKLGGKLVSFNVDPNFADALDGLIVVDLAKTDVRVLERYMGKDAARAFLGFHSRRAAS
jgi:putative hemolysin